MVSPRSAQAVPGSPRSGVALASRPSTGVAATSAYERDSNILGLTYFTMKGISLPRWGYSGGECDYAIAAADDRDWVFLPAVGYRRVVYATPMVTSLGGADAAEMTECASNLPAAALAVVSSHVMGYAGDTSGYNGALYWAGQMNPIIILDTL